MANADRPNGFSPVKTLSGAPITGLSRGVYSPAADRSSDTTNNHGDIYVGDPISISTAGAVTPANSGDVVAGVVVGVGKAGTVNFGASGASQIVPAPMFDPTDLTKRYLAFGEAGWVYFVPAKDVLFEVQSASDLDLEVGSQADINLVADTAHGSRATGRSNVELVAASAADVRVAEIVLAPDNDDTLANARYLVAFELQTYDQ